MQDPTTDPTPAPSPPLVELDEARIECASGLLFDGICCRGVGDRVALLGPWDALFRLLGGDGRLTAGGARIDGRPVPAAVATGQVGIARHDVPFPARWNGNDYLTHSAQLAGGDRAPQRRARAVVEQLGLGRVAGRRLQVMAPAERRAILIAHAMITEPTTLVLEAPLDDLDQASAASLAVVIDRAVQGRKLLVSVRDAAAGGPGRGLLDTVDSILVLGPRGDVEVLQAEALSRTAGRRYVVAVPRQAGPFAAELARRGVHVEGLQAGPESSATLVVARRELGEQPGRFLVRLAEGRGTDAILDASMALNLPILHLAPAELADPDEREGERC